jgi:polar amino acid transport system substrate-binding protein
MSRRTAKLPARVRWLAVGFAFAIVGTACGSDGSADPGDSGSPSGLERVREKGLFPGFYGDNRQYSYLDLATSTYTGAEADIVSECAERLGVDTVNPVGLDWDGLIPGLQSRRIDIIAAGMAYFPERAEVAAHTQFIYHFGDVAMVPEGNPMDIHSYQDMADKGAVVGSIAGSLTTDTLKKYGIEYKEYANVDPEIADLQAGRLDVVMNDDGGARAYLDANPDLPVEVADPWDYQGNFYNSVFYFNKNDVDLRNAYNDCISDLKDEGFVAQSLEKYNIGTAANVDPVDAGP